MTNRTITVEHSRTCVFIFYYIFSTIFAELLFFIRDQGSLKTTILVPGHFVLVCILTAPTAYFLSWRLCKSRKIDMSSKGINTINIFNYAIVAVSWDEIEHIQFINLFFGQIVVIYQAGSGDKAWFYHFSFGSTLIRNAIKKYRPDLIVDYH